MVDLEEKDELKQDEKSKKVKNSKTDKKTEKKEKKARKKSSKKDDRTKIQKVKDTIKDGITYVFSTRYSVLYFFTIILLKTLLFSQDTVFWQETIWLWYVRQTVFFIIIMVAPMFLFRNSKYRFIYGVILDLFISILLLCDEMYYIYARNVVSVMQSGNLQYKDEILAALPTLFRVRQVLFFIDFVIYLIFSFTKFVKIKVEEKFRLTPILASIAVVCVLCMHYHFVPESLELVTGFIYNKKNSVRYGTIYGFHVVDVYKAFTNSKNTKFNNYNEMIDKYNEFKTDEDSLNPIKSEYDEIAKDKNVIVLQLESVQDFVVGATINGKEITPNLNAFLNENIRLSNMHATSYTTTSDSEHSVISSLYPLENGEAFSKYYGNTYDDIFTAFKERGYYNMYAHGNYSYFWNRKNVTAKLQIDDLHFLGDFEDESELIRTYLSDELLYKQTLDYYKKAIDEGNSPIFYDIVAASSHKPFELAGIQDKESKVNIDVGDELRGTQFGNYLEAVNYADYAFGIFVNKLKEQGLYDDTVLIVFGDHYGVLMYDEQFIKYLGYEPDNFNDARMQYEFSHVLCGMKIPGINSMVIDEPVSKSDIKPTLSQICGLEDKFSIGTSVFNRKSYVAVNTGVVITKNYYYTGTEWYYLESGEKVDMNTIEPELKDILNLYVEKANQEIEISNSVVVNNLLQGIDY